jgi:hypothetical protein
MDRRGFSLQISSIYGRVGRPLIWYMIRSITFSDSKCRAYRLPI